MIELKSTSCVIVQIKMLTDTATRPTYGSSYAAGADLYVDSPIEPVIIRPHETILIPTGVAMAISDGFVGIVAPRSGLSLRTALREPNSIGVIDADYRGEIKGMFENCSNEQIILEHGTRFAQILFMPVHQAYFKEVDELPITDRSTGGFGSTGTN
jgi:dUTP pyrophosphatase